MSSIQEEDVETGVDVIDVGHGRIAGIFDELFRSLAAGADHEGVVADVARLVDAFCEHIERENDLMTRIAYPGAVAHLVGHINYFERFCRFPPSGKRRDGRGICPRRSISSG